MKIELTNESIERIARRVTELLKERTTDEEEYLTTKEAAMLLRISPDRLRHLKNHFPHVKVGGESQGKLLFLRRGLIENYVNAQGL